MLITISLLRRSGGVECVRYKRTASTGDMLDDNEAATQEYNFDTESRSSASTAFLGQTSTSFIFNGLISRSKKYEVTTEPKTNSVKRDDEELSYRGFSNFDEIALTDPNDLHKDHGGT